ncbi:MAG: efflux RND transporter permease subunit [Jaaginema sp. PMC 1079.18]|nr:efflux RND transporter permease subunit [Jaaginema sp. PMC 1080.18]MEC4849663.1 efflux RND transporter permease subunit [Jaaginema sp. PMC 1079.18]MEC4866077.1 efflux RND transporter permease subunit [Jaaginema sp. PMC 1078.18]
MNSQTPSRFSLSGLSIRRHIAVLMLTIATIVVGIFCIFRLQVDLLPAITYPRIGLRADAPGVSPEVAVEEITKPLEEVMSATDGVAQVFSETREGRISINLFFAPGEDIDRALSEATATLNRARDRLPDVVEEPRLFKYEPSQLPIYEFALDSDNLDPVELRVFADEEIERELGIIPGVASVNVTGGLREEVTVELDLRRLQTLGIEVQDVLDSLRDRNQDIAGGRLQGEAGEPLTRAVGRFQNAEEVRNLSLTLPGNSEIGSQRRIKLQDIATIVDGTEEQRLFVLLNGKPAVKVSVQKQPDANTITVINAVKQRIQFLRDAQIIPEAMNLVETLDESRFVKASITNVVTAGLTGTILAAIAVFIFLGSLRQTFIIVAAIPLATLAAVILMKLFGLSLNVFSLGGLALGVGIVVDNSIVMLENIAVGIESSPDRTLEKAINSGQEVESALVASTATNLVAVLPFLLIGGFVSLLFSELILTISFAVAASLAVALTVVPMLASRLLRLRHSSGIANFGLIRGFNQRFITVTRRYKNVLDWVLRFRILFIILVIAILSSSSIWMNQRLPQELLPQINTDQANLRAQFPPGTTLETNQKVMQAVDEILLSQPETQYTFTTIGGALFADITVNNILRGSSTITLKPGTDVQAFSDRVTQELEKLNLVNVRLRLSPGQVRGIILSNSPVRADIDVMLQGADKEVLEAAGRQVLEVLDRDVTNARFRPDADRPQPEVQILPDWERLAELGLTTTDIGEPLQTALLGSVPTQLQRGDRLVDIRVRLDSESRQRLDQLAQLPLFSLNNRPIALREVATLQKGQAPGDIQRINQRQVFIISGDLAEEASLSEALAETQAAIASLNLPEGVVILPSTTAESNQELQRSLGILGGLAAFLVFVVMAVQYNSLVDPLVIILTVPLALAGGIFGLYLTQTPVGATVLVGAVLLVGIVVNNAIVMVELANQLRAKHRYSHAIAMLNAAPQRLRPILMTTITTVLGLFPLALGLGEGSEFLQPLGVVVFSGLSLATFLTLFMIPCFYVLLHDIFGGKYLPQFRRY